MKLFSQVLGMLLLTFIDDKEAEEIIASYEMAWEKCEACHKKQHIWGLEKYPQQNQLLLNFRTEIIFKRILMNTLIIKSLGWWDFIPSHQVDLYLLFPITIMLRVSKEI